MRNATLCLIVKGNPVSEILLGCKKRGLGVGKFNGFGGKVEENESIKEAAIREVLEEAGIVVDVRELQSRGTIIFDFPQMHESNSITHIFMVNSWQGEPQETNEMLPQWFFANEIPYHAMWQDDILWMSKVLAGENIHATCIFEDDNETVRDFIVGIE